MHLKKTVAERRQIGKEATCCVSSDSKPKKPSPSPFLLLHPQLAEIQTIDPFESQDAIDASIKLSENHLTIDIPPSSPQILISAPHKRPVATQSPSPFYLVANDDHFSRGSNRACLSLSSSRFLHSCPSNVLSFLSSFQLSIPLGTKQFARELFRHFLRARLICFHLRFLLLLSVPPLYLFFLVVDLRFFILFVLAIIALYFTLLVSLSLAVPHLSSIRLFLAGSVPLKLSLFSSSLTKSCTKQVVWSIGSKPVSEKKANSGSWVQKYSNGHVYEGEFHRGKCSGSGVYYYSMKGRYEGDWIDGKYDGYGVETWAKGSRYRGQHRQGMRHGIGVYRFYTGDVYAGEWSNGQCHGCGVYNSEDGSRYVGDLKWGVKHGLGHYHFRNGDTYAGEYFADKMHGFGVYHFANGHRYEGAWHEGRRQGLGLYTFRNGETQAGHWENGVLNSHNEQNTNPLPPFSLGHSKVLDAVQQARLAAKKAQEVPMVDERVNRAVMAANRGANAARVAAIKAVQKQMHHNSNNELL